MEKAPQKRRNAEESVENVYDSKRPWLNQPRLFVSGLLSITRSHGFGKIRIHIAVFLIYPAVVAVQVQLVHSESNREIFRLTLLHVGIAILHAYPLHDRAAARIVYVVGGGNIGKALFFQKRYERGGSLACNSPTPISYKRKSRPLRNGF